MPRPTSALRRRATYCSSFAFSRRADQHLCALSLSTRFGDVLRRDGARLTLVSLSRGRARRRLFRVLTYRPIASNDPLPTIVHIHGGGFVMGAPEMKDVENRLFASELKCAIYSVDHRLAPEAPHPAPVEDIYSVFAWLHANAAQLGLDPARIGIKGESGGGGFAAAAALYARDRQGPKFAFQHLIYPMIDDRSAVRKDLHPYVGEFVWTQENNYFGWRSLLGEEPGAADVSPYAAAARAADLSGLPPTYISVGGLDLFLEENMIYADRLSRAGVPVELHMYPRAYHGFYRVTNARVTKQAEHDNREALRRFLHG